MKRNFVFFIADDDQDDQELFVTALQQIDESCTCITAINGEEALKKLFDEQIKLPDFIFLDLNMPKVNGKQCLEKIKQHKNLQNIPVIIYSTSANEKEASELSHMGATMFMQKPNRFSELFTALEKIVNYNWN